jgi:hypothetical protein
MGDLRGLSATATISSPKMAVPRRIRSICPLVTGSKVPGYTARTAVNVILRDLLRVKAINRLLYQERHRKVLKRIFGEGYGVGGPVAQTLGVGVLHPAVLKRR